MFEPFPDRGTIRFFKHRDAGAALNASFAFARRNARELFVGFFALVMPFAIISGLGAYLFYSSFGDIFAGFDPASGGDPFGGDDPLASGGFEGLATSYFLSALGGLLAFAMAQAAVAGYVRLYREGEQGGITVGLLWDETKRLILPTIGMTMLVGVVGILGSFTLVALLSQLSPFLGIAVFLAFWIWILPFVHVAYASRMTESSSIATAVARAFALIRGEWLYAFGALILVWIVTFGILIAMSIPVSAVMAIVGVSTTSPDVGAQMQAAGMMMVPLQILGLAAYILPSLAAFFVHGRLANDLDGSSVEDELDIFEQGIDATDDASWQTDARPAGQSAAATPEATSGAVPKTSGEEASEPDGDRDASGPSGFRGGGFGA